jgi:hypothetical protein
MRFASVTSQKLPSFWAFLWVSLVLCLIGWGGLIALIILSLPTLGPRWLFFFLFTLALSGTALPVVYFLNRRFPSVPLVESSVVLREAMWVGVFGSLLAWLQLGRVLNSGLAVVLAVGLVLVEYLLRLGEHSTWTPGGRTPALASDPVDTEDEEEEDEEDEDG